MSEFEVPARKWASDPAPERQPHPAPEVGARIATTEEIPRSARPWVVKAKAAGWNVQATYALGTSVDRKGEPGYLTHSLAVRMQHPDGLHRAVVCWNAHALDGEGQRVEPAAAKWSKDCAYAWRSGVELPLPIDLAASSKKPDAETLAAYLIKPAPRRKWVEMLEALDVPGES